MKVKEVKVPLGPPHFLPVILSLLSLLHPSIDTLSNPELNTQHLPPPPQHLHQGEEPQLGLTGGGVLARLVAMLTGDRRATPPVDRTRTSWTFGLIFSYVPKTFCLVLI